MYNKKEFRSIDILKSRKFTNKSPNEEEKKGKSIFFQPFILKILHPKENLITFGR